MKTHRKVGIFSWYGFDTPIIERFKKIKTVGFDSTMLWWGDRLAFEELNKSELVAEVIKNKLIIDNIHVPFDTANDIWSDDASTRDRITDRYKEWLNDCSTYGIPAMVIHISKGYVIDKPNIHGLRSIEKLTNEAERLNVRIAVENTRKNELLDYLFTRIESRCLGICYDTSHGVLYGDKNFDLLNRYKERIICFHISDNDGAADRHWGIGKGIIDWKNFIEKFPLEYDGVLSLEIYPKNKNENEDMFLAEAYASITDIEKKLYERL